MNHHLTDEQLSAALLAEGDANTAIHLAGCEECRRDVERMRTVLAGARAESLALAERPQGFWREQRLAVIARLSAGHEFETRPLAWAASLAIFALAATFLTESVPIVQPQASRSQGAVVVSMSPDSDHDLLVDVARFTRRDVPRALEPATLIAQELHRAAGRKSDR